VRKGDEEREEVHIEFAVREPTDTDEHELNRIFMEVLADMGISGDKQQIMLALPPQEKWTLIQSLKEKKENGTD